MVVLAIAVTSCGGESQEQIFRQAGVDAGKRNEWSKSDCQTAAPAEVESHAKSHPAWTPTQRRAYEAAYVDGCLSALTPPTGTAQ